ncbi:MAG: UDP- glucuronosyltransferase [Gemmatimonadetes bacterium]|nr:UDP- glucuronosyltransferase [Gemmatimonadota bacterium]
MSNGSYRIVFVVQGEGRGHLSQALALKELLEEAGHHVTGLLVGGGERRPLPDYFARRMQMEPVRFPSPLTVPGPDRTGVSVPRTTLYNLARAGAYRRAVEWIRGQVEDLRPDLVVNFYDALGGVALGSGRIPVVSVAHQYLLGHPGTPAPPFRPLELATFRLLNRASAPGATPRLALSFRDLPDGPTPHTRVVPPLLRRRVREAPVETADHLLVYVVNDGYGDAIARWHERNRHVLVHAFWDRPGAPEEERPHANLTFHRLSDTRFLELMRTCRGFVGTAGFESVAEALWLGKPVLVVPTGNQVEQAWNAREAVAAGAGIARRTFALDDFLAYLPNHRDVSTEFRGWVQRGGARIRGVLEDAAAARTAGSGRAATARAE